ncbi:AbiH family protein [Dermabacteraceae bacterium P7006]
MKTLWIIGNGFDIQHGLKSSYKDFSKWLHREYDLSTKTPCECQFSAAQLPHSPEYDPQFCSSDDTYIAEFICSILNQSAPTNTNRELRETLMNCIRETPKNTLFKRGTHTDQGPYELTKYLNSSFNEFKDFDKDGSLAYKVVLDLFNALTPEEKEITLWSSLEDGLGMIDYQPMLYDLLCEDKEGDTLNWGTAGQISDCKPNIQYALSRIRHLFFSWVQSELNPAVNETQPQEYFKPLFSKAAIKFVNFNYTDTLEKTYNVKESDILHIHGKAGAGCPDLVFGHSRPNEEDSEDKYSYWEFGELVHAINRDLQKELKIDELTKFVSDSTPSKVVFYGFGAGEADRPYLEKIKNLQYPETEWILLGRPGEQPPTQLLIKLRAIHPIVAFHPIDSPELMEIISSNGETD